MDYVYFIVDGLTAERRTNLIQLWAECAPPARALPAGELVATLAREAGLVSG